MDLDMEGYETVHKAWITELQRYSVHDGPGIRTTVFFKGCPLKCIWCQNPETWNMMPELLYYNRYCICCMACVDSCPNEALRMYEDHIAIERKLCKRCFACTSVCPAEALAIVGKLISMEEIMHQLMRDKLFYSNSGGGVTLSGGEPLAQHKFAAELLCSLHKEGIHTAIETSGYSEAAKFEEVLQHTNLILYDIKHTDTSKHKKYTGVGNEEIINNLYLSRKKGCDLIIRVPLIPDLNDDDRNLEQLAYLAKDSGAFAIHLLPFHQMGVSKWKAMDKEYSLEGKAEMLLEQAETVGKRLRDKGLRVGIGGLDCYPENMMKNTREGYNGAI